MGRLFGTDGVRGIANAELTCQLAYRLGQAAAVFLGPQIVIGRDTRVSGPMLEAAAAAGVMSAGGTALRAGVIPTPGVAFLVRDGYADGGLVISASHNPPEYNGIKLFDDQGFKLPDETEDAIEDFILAGGLEATDGPEGQQLAVGEAVGDTMVLGDAVQRYVRHAVKSVKDQGMDLSGLHIALDVGHGASTSTSAWAFRELGAEVTCINDDFNGCDINVGCGSTHLEPLAQLMEESGADIGVAHDGDADRVMLMTPSGKVIDGDFMAAALALDMRDRGVLANNTVVSTVMCNLGFTVAMARAGIEVVQTSVGDRYVLEEMRAHGHRIGGEQSGHMILLDYNSTGDGLVTACQYLAALKRSGKSVEEFAAVMERFPQTLINVPVTDKGALDYSDAIRQATDGFQEKLGDEGRILIRPSGTEPLVRVMVEAKSAAIAEEVAQSLAQVVERELG